MENGVCRVSNLRPADCFAFGNASQFVQLLLKYPWYRLVTWENGLDDI